MSNSFWIPGFTRWIVGTTVVVSYIENLFKEKDAKTEEVKSNQNGTSKQFLFRNAKAGFDLIIKGISEQNGESLINMRKGVELLKNKYLDTDELLNDLSDYAMIEKIPNIQEFLKKLYRSAKPYISFLISDELQSEILSDFQKERNKSLDSIKKDIENIYTESLNGKEINCYIDLLDEAGNIYKKLVDYYFELSFIPDKTYNHELVYEMAEVILHNTNFYFCRDLSQKQLAEDITNHIFKHIHGESQAEKMIGQKENEVQINVEDIYKHYLGFDIKTYPYYLNVCSVIYRELVKYSMGIAENENDKEEKTVEAKMFSDMIAILYKVKYDFMQGLSKEQFESDVNQTYLANKKRKNISEILS